MTELALLDAQCPASDCDFEGTLTARVLWAGFEWDCPDCGLVIYEPFDNDPAPEPDPSEPWMDPDSIDDTDEEWGA